MRLFIDDERFPVHEFDYIVRTLSDFDNVINTLGTNKITYISFDHDLGANEPTGYDIVKKLIDIDMERDILSPNFDFYVHSQNPIGAKNIETYLNNYLRVVRGNR